MKANIEVERRYPGTLKQKIDAVYKERGRKEGNKFLWNMFWFVLYSEKVRRKIRLKGIAVKERLVVFEHDSALKGRNEMMLLLDYMLKNGYQKTYRLALITDEPETMRLYQKQGVIVIPRKTKDEEHVSLKAYKYVAMAKYVFFTGLQTASTTKKEEQIYIQLCQDCDLLHRPKATGIDTILDYAIISGSYFVYEKSEYLDWMEEHMLPLGRPVWDSMLGRNLSTKKVLKEDGVCQVFWEPMKRESQILLKSDPKVSAFVGLPLMEDVDSIKQLDVFCKEQGVHLYVAGKITGVQSDCLKGNWKAITFLEYEKLDYDEVVCQMDAYLTDYGTRSVDFLIFDKPMGYTMDDLELYKQQVGMLFDEPGELMAGAQISNVNELKEFLLSIKQGEDLEAEKRRALAAKLTVSSKDYCKGILDYFKIDPEKR